MGILPHTAHWTTSNSGPPEVITLHSDRPPCYCRSCYERTYQADRRREELAAILRNLENAKELLREFER